jgi:hypothetical protein
MRRISQMDKVVAAIFMGAIETAGQDETFWHCTNLANV